jgi:hypothetical protein
MTAGAARQWPMTNGTQNERDHLLTVPINWASVIGHWICAQR